MGQAKIKRDRRRKQVLTPRRTLETKQAQSSSVIDTTGISEAEKATDKFKLAYSEMFAQLAKPGFIQVLCAHEAAHMVYFSMMGVKNFDTLPAKIRFDSKLNDYRGHLAAIQVLDKIPDWEPGRFWDWLFKLACAHAAGGVVARKKMPSSDGGDQDDKDRFRTVCDLLSKEPSTLVDFDDIWSKATRQVSEHLENAQFMAAIADEVSRLRKLFVYEGLKICSA